MSQAALSTRPVIQGRLATLAAVVLTLAAIGGAAYMSSRPGAQATDVTPVSLGSGAGEAPRVGSAAPPFAVKAADGTTLALSDLRGHPVWLTFGASWCQSCRAENPDIQAVWDKHRATGLRVVAVFLAEQSADVADYGRRVSLTYTLIPDPDSKLAMDYRIAGLPSHFFIDSNGTLRNLRIGSLAPGGMEAALKTIGA